MDKRFVSLISILFFAAFLFIAVSLFSLDSNNRFGIARLLRATENLTPSAKNSLVFAFPLKATSDGESKVKVDVFVRTDSGRPVRGQTVKIISSFGELTPSTVITDNDGKATFQLSSNTPGKTELTAIINDSTEIEQKVIATFE